MRWDEEDLPVILLEDGERVSTTTRTVEVGPPRRRRREMALAVAAVLVVAAVGFLGDDGDGESASPATPTTKRSATTRRTTSSRPPRSTTTTSWPQLVRGTGPLLPGGTGTAVVLVNGSHVEVVDLDSGDRCITDPPGTDVWPHLASAASNTYALIDTGGSFVAVDGTCEVRPVMRRDSAWPIASAAESIWFFDDARGAITQRDITSGESQHRIDVAPFQPVQAVGMGDRLVIGIHGDVSLVDPADGSTRSIGTGHPIAAIGDTVALVQCPALECELVTIDVRTLDRRSVGGVAPVPWEHATFSPDGRLLALRTAGRSGAPPIPAVVDLDRGSVTTYEEFGAISFTRGGGWILASQHDEIVAFKPDGETVRLDAGSSADGMIVTIATS